jgi:PAS domain S-box-containing protein
MSQAGDTRNERQVFDFNVAGGAADVHAVQFYEDERSLLERMLNFASEGLEAGDTVIVIATEPHAVAIRSRLRSPAVDVAAAIEQGRLLFLDAHATLEKFMIDGEPSTALFEAELGRLIAERSRAAAPGKLRAFGEMVNVLWQNGHRNAAIRVEELWNELQKRHSFTLLCAYALGNFFKQPAALQRVCATHTHVLPDAGGELSEAPLPPEYARTLAAEIAEREEVEHALRESLRELTAKDEELRDFVENAPIGLHRLDPNGVVLWANRRELEMLGYAAEEYVGRRISEFHLDPSVVEDMLARLRDGDAVNDVEARMRAKDGSTRCVLIHASAYARNGRFVHARCFTQDISRRKKADEARRQSEEHLRIVTDAVPTLVSYVDDERRYRFVSAAYERWFGRDKAEFLGKHLADVLGDGYAGIEPYVERALRGETVAFEADITYADGRGRSIEATYVPQPSEQGTAGFVALVSDVTERKRLERFGALAAARAERLWKITAAIADAVTSEQVYEALVDRIHETLSATSTALWLVDEDGRNARLVRQKGYAEEVARRFASVSLDTGQSTPAIDSIRRAEPIWIATQTELLEQYPHLRPAVTPGADYRVSCLPLIVHGRVLGTLGLTTQAPPESTAEERAFLLLAARHASQAVERLRLFELERTSRAAAHEAAVRMGVLSHASQVFVETELGLEERLRGIVMKLGAMLHSAVGISLLKADGMLHTCAVHHPVPEAERMLRELSADTPIPLGEGITGTVAANGVSQVIPAVDPELIAARSAPTYRPFLAHYPVHGLICAALRSRGRIIGTVTLSRADAGPAYTRADVALVEELAARAAGAIENSLLYEESVEARRRAEQLYHFAQAVAAADNVRVVFEAALGAIEGALGTQRAAILTLDADNVMRFSAYRNLSDEYRATVEGHCPWPLDATAPEPVLVPDVTLDASLAPFAELFRSEGIGALAFIPLVTGERLVGKFMLYYEKQHSFSTHDVDMALAIANHLASVMARFSAVAALEETLRANELFAGALAHDLRNPLSAMMTAAQLVLMMREGENAADPTAKPLSKILASGQRIARMIEQLLDFTRARSGGGIEIQPSEGHAGELLAQASDELELVHADWTIHYEASGNLAVVWDCDRMLQVISNLIANAGQHGKSGSAIVLRLDGSHDDDVKLEIHNEGAIPAGLLPNIFDPFRTSRHRGAQSGGLGLGLFIVRQIVRAHGGTVTVSSSEVTGTTFTLTLPRTARPSRDARPRHVN